MNLPDSYLADLPSGAEMTPELIREACRALARNRARHLRTRLTEDMIRDLASAATLWRDPHSPFMEAAVTGLSAGQGLSEQTARAGLGAIFEGITDDALRGWVEQDLGHPRRLDGFCATTAEQASGRRARAFGPELFAHFTAGNLPAAALTSMVGGLLVRSAQFVKCAAGSSLVPRLFAHSVRQVDPGLGSCLEVAEWSRTRPELDASLLAMADAVTVTGGDEAVAALRERLPSATWFVGHGHKVSFSFLCQECLSGGHLVATVREVAKDVAAWNQLGCLSPHAVYVEKGGQRSPEDVAGDLAGALETLEREQPRGRLFPGEAAGIRSRRAFYEVRAASGSGTRLWSSADSTAWTVVYEDSALFQPSCLNRFIYVKPVADLGEALRGADGVRRHVSCVGLAAPRSRQAELATELGEWGVSRVCSVGRMQRPPLLWRHDGRPALGELVRWVDLEL